MKAQVLLTVLCQSQQEKMDFLSLKSVIFNEACAN